jgi:hypothetical protein
LREQLNRFNFYLKNPYNLKQALKRKMNQTIKVCILEDVNAKALSEWKRGKKEILRYQYDLNSNSLVVDVVSNINVECFNYALADKTSIKFIKKDKDSSSLVIGAEDIHLEQIKIEEFALEFRRRNFEKIDLLKVNIEGGEFTLLPHIIQSGLINKITYLQIQFHNYKATSIVERDRIRSELERTHVQQWGFPFVWESWEIKSNL